MKKNQIFQKKEIYIASICNKISKMIKKTLKKTNTKKMIKIIGSFAIDTFAQ